MQFGSAWPAIWVPSVAGILFVCCYRGVPARASHSCCRGLPRWPQASGTGCPRFAGWDLRPRETRLRGSGTAGRRGWPQPARPSRGCH